MLLAGLLSLTLKPSAVANDIITLNSGEVITGTITSENATQLVIEVSNASRTIFHSRLVSKSEIKANQSETAAEKQERLAYDAVKKYRLNPDQEFTAAQYDAGITACQKFLETYPASEYAAAVNPLGVQLQQEKEQVAKGLVKFGSRWMSSNQKVVETDVRVSFDKVQRMQRALTDLEKQHDQINSEIADLRMMSVKANDEINAAKDNPSRTEAHQKRLAYDRQTGQRQAFLNNIESKINHAQSDLAGARQEYKAVKVKRDTLIDLPQRKNAAEQDLRVSFDKVQRMQRALTDLEKQHDQINSEIADLRVMSVKANDEDFAAKDNRSRTEANQKLNAYGRQSQHMQDLLSNLNPKIAYARSDLEFAKRECQDTKNEITEIIRAEADAARRLIEAESKKIADEKKRQERQVWLEELQAERDRQALAYQERVIAQAIAEDERKAQLQAKVVPGKVTIIEWSWHKEGFGAFMTATFTIANGKKSDIKDITIRCDHTAKSGTRIDSNTRTIYDIIKAGETKTFQNFDMGFIHSQAVHSSATIEDFETVQ